MKLFYVKNILFILFASFAVSTANAAEIGFSWPIDCIPGYTCVGQEFRIGYPDVNTTGLSHSCGEPGYTGHQGTDILVAAAEHNISVLAAADGVVRWIEDGVFDQCPDSRQWGCNEQRKSTLPLNSTSPASLGFNAGNFIVIEHSGEPTRYLTLYAHLKTGSLRASVGQRIRRGDIIANVGSSGNSLTPHLHFGVYREFGKFYRPVDPWKGDCNATSAGLWLDNPPYRMPVISHAPLINKKVVQ